MLSFHGLVDAAADAGALAHDLVLLLERLLLRAHLRARGRAEQRRGGVAAERLGPAGRLLALGAHLVAARVRVVVAALAGVRENVDGGLPAAHARAPVSLLRRRARGHAGHRAHGGRVVLVVGVERGLVAPLLRLLRRLLRAARGVAAKQARGVRLPARRVRHAGALPRVCVGTSAEHGYERWCVRGTGWLRAYARGNRPQK